MNNPSALAPATVLPVLLARLTPALAERTEHWEVVVDDGSRDTTPVAM